MRHQSIDARLDRKRFEHMLAHEYGKIADRYHGDGLMEEIERLLVLDAEAPAERGAIGREGIVHLDARHRPQFLLKGVDVRSESAEVFRYGERRIRNNVESGRLSVRVLKGEHLRERHFLLETVIAEPAQDDRVGVEVAQRHRLSDEPRFAAFRFVVAENVRLQVSL